MGKGTVVREPAPAHANCPVNRAEPNRAEPACEYPPLGGPGGPTGLPRPMGPGTHRNDNPAGAEPKVKVSELQANAKTAVALGLRIEKLNCLSRFGYLSTSSVSLALALVGIITVTGGWAAIALLAVASLRMAIALGDMYYAGKLLHIAQREARGEVIEKDERPRMGASSLGNFFHACIQAARGTDAGAQASDKVWAMRLTLATRTAMALMAVIAPWESLHLGLGGVKDFFTPAGARAVVASRNASADLLGALEFLDVYVGSLRERQKEELASIERELKGRGGPSNCESTSQMNGDESSSSAPMPSAAAGWDTRSANQKARAWQEWLNLQTDEALNALQPVVATQANANPQPDEAPLERLRGYLNNMLRASTALAIMRATGGAIEHPL